GEGDEVVGSDVEARVRLLDELDDRLFRHARLVHADHVVDEIRARGKEGHRDECYQRYSEGSNGSHEGLLGSHCWESMRAVSQTQRWGRAGWGAFLVRRRGQGVAGRGHAGRKGEERRRKGEGRSATSSSRSGPQREARG